MRSSSYQIPDLPTITRGLSSVIANRGFAPGRLRVLSREFFSRASTFPCEIIRCQTEDGRQLQLFCKYSGGQSHNAYGHRGGVLYETMVYHRILRSLSISTPDFYGTYSMENTGDVCLVIAYLNETVSLNGHQDPGAICLAARWLGQFHAANEKHVANSKFADLKTHDVEYYLGWSRRTLLFSDQLRHYYPWLAKVCRAFEELVDALLMPPRTIIHGEYFASNILLRCKTVYPVDWESAAIGVGEIDLASLTQGNWPVDIVSLCVSEYQRTRWAKDPPIEFEHKLAVSRLYWLFRWLGDRPERTTHPDYRGCFEALRFWGKRLRLI